jgi:dipeptidase E
MRPYDTRVKSTAKRRVMTMGGGGFLMEPENPLLDLFLFSLSERKKPKVCFIPTASGDAQSFLDLFYDNMWKHQVEPSHLSLFKPPRSPLRDFVLDKDVFYVGGGNTRNLIVLWKEWGLDRILEEAYRAGKVMGGISAGSICWYEQGVTDSVTGELNPLKCVGILKGSNCPHYDGEKDRRPAYHRLILAGMPDGIACDDGVAAVFENEKVIEFVSSRPSAKGYFVTKEANKIKETAVQPRFLGE